MRKSKYSAEVRERALRMVREHQIEHGSEWATIESIASKLGCTSETLRRWVRQAQVDQGQRPGLGTSERERLLALERENRELRQAKPSQAKPSQANKILRKASAYFAQAEFDRRFKP